jgi:hypothetical protein
LHAFIRIPRNSFAPAVCSDGPEVAASVARAATLDTSIMIARKPIF